MFRKNGSVFCKKSLDMGITFQWKIPRHGSTLSIKAPGHGWPIWLKCLLMIINLSADCSASILKIDLKSINFQHSLREIPRHGPRFARNPETWNHGATWVPLFPKNHPWRWVWGLRLEPHTPVTTKPEYPQTDYDFQYYFNDINLWLSIICLSNVDMWIPFRI